MTQNPAASASRGKICHDLPVDARFLPQKQRGTIGVHTGRRKGQNGAPSTRSFFGINSIFSRDLSVLTSRVADRPRMAQNVTKTPHVRRDSGLIASIP
ncbi:MAG: hypothetical protein OJF58_002038 [Enhydrobacter sp.]|nr:MAG: hypothetical protein OJF58_002038 [Enhydrobacter sp.]